MVSVYTLGAARIDAAKVSIKLTSPRKFALLLRLCAEPGRLLSRATVIEMVYPDQANANAAHSLREIIYQLRRGGVEFTADRAGIGIAAESVHCDFAQILACDSLSNEQIRAIAAGFLPGYEPDHSEAFAEWYDVFRHKTVSALCRLLVSDIERAKIAGNWARVEDLARACLALDPMNERATLMLAEAFVIAGAKAKAVRILDDYTNEIGSSSAPLALPASLLKRRIKEKLPEKLPANESMRFVGRSAEIGMLTERLAEVRAGEIRCTSIRGEPGIGKTRLMTEFATICVLDGCNVVKVSAQPLDQHRPMAAFADLIPQLLSLPGSIGCSPESLQVLQRLTVHRPSPRSLENTAARSTDRSKTNVDVATQIARAICDVVDAVSGEAPLVMLVDDAQWLDDISRSMIHSFIRRAGTSRVYVLMAARPVPADESTKLITDARVSTFTIAPIDLDSCLALLAEVFQDNSSADLDLRRWMFEASGGNPFFLGCLIDHYSTTGERFVIPDRLSALVDQRLSTLSSNAAHTLHAIHALGNHATVDRVIGVIELPVVELLEAVTELEDRHLITNGDRIYVAHWLIREAVDRLRTPVSSRIIHSKIAAILQEEANRTLEASLLWACGEHWVSAGNARQATEALRICGEHALGMGRAREAGELFLRASSYADPYQRRQLLEEAIRTAAAAAEIDIVSKAAELLGRSHDAPTHDDVELAELNARIHAEPSHQDELIARLKRCVEEPTATAEHRVEAGMALLMWCDLNRAPEIASSMYPSLESLYEHIGETHTTLILKSLLIFHSNFGDVDAVPEIARKLQSIALTSREDVAADILRKAGIGFWRAGCVNESIETLKQALAMAHNCGSRRLERVIALMLCGNCLDVGDNIASARYLDVVNTLSSEVGDGKLERIYIPILADTAFANGDDARIAEIARTCCSQDAARGRRRDRWQHSMKLYASRLDHRHIDFDREIERLATIQAPAHELGDVGDFETAILSILLGREGKCHEARAVLENYFRKYRRPRTPLASTLRRAITETDFTAIPVWARLGPLNAYTSKLPGWRVEA